MALFGYKNDTLDFKMLESFSEKIDLLLKQDAYISKKEYKTLVGNISSKVDELKIMEERNVLADWCKRNRINLKTLLELMKKYTSVEKLIDEHNTTFVSTHLVAEKDYLDEILLKDDPHIILDEEQRNVVLSDEDFTLVVAGAGAGKTTTIEAKVKYLVDKKNISPDRILIVSFTRKATDELRARMKRLNIHVDIATFHSIGNTIIKEAETVRHKIAEDGFMFRAIKDYLTTKLEDEFFIKKILLFFASYLKMPFEGDDTALLFKALSDENITTIKSDLKTLLDNFQKEQTENKLTLHDEKVRSIDECRIANFLYINGIDYQYEPIYRYGFADTIKPYCPDFLIKQGDKDIFLEHFGISQDGKNNRFTIEEIDTYKKHINDKIKLHRQHGTTLIYTFSKYNDGRDLISHLKEELRKAEIILDSKSDIEIYRQIAKNAEDKYFNKFIQLICTFIGRFKVNNFTPSKFDEWKITLKDERTKLFVDICYQCYLAYSRELKDENAIDFEDMINNAANILDKKIESGEKYPYDYILVDEYQDISLQRFDLCEKLSRASDAKIIAVGDDWQSIFKFSGAKISLFTKFEQRMHYAKTLRITKTYRNSQELIDIAGGFIMENKQQLSKKLTSDKRMKDPVLLMSYNDSYEKNEDGKGPFYRLGEAIEKSLEDIVLRCGEEKSVLLIGRYNFEGKRLSILEDLFLLQNDEVRSKKYPKIPLTFLTAHSSKGLGYDNVIIINGKDDLLGFPSKIEDDPVMKLVIKDDESDVDFAEERRLFYVALTRTKNRVYIITPQFKPSKFILEIKDHFDNVILRGNDLSPQENQDFRRKCPICGYPLQKRSSKDKKIGKEGTSLWICSNDPEVCGFMTNSLIGGSLSISKCPDCEDGFLIVKPTKEKGRCMLGCTNYKNDNTGCNCVMYPENFTQDKTEIAIKFFNPKMTLDNMVFAGYPISELVFSIINIINEIKRAREKFSMSEFCLIDFLQGKKTKTIESWKIFEIEGFGMIDEKFHKRIKPLIIELRKHGVIDINRDNFNAVSVLIEKPTDDIIRNIFSEVMPR